MVPKGRTVAAAGHRARQLFVCAVLLLTSWRPAAANPQPDVVVTENGGVYSVSATFTVPQGRATAIAVLLDFERIPDYMPDMVKSTVIGRSSNGVIVEQAANARFMMFSKRVHLVLEVVEQGGVIRFRDRCGKSFESYEGSWTVVEGPAGTAITYALAAKPAFDVPGFVLRRLMKRDASQLIAQLTRAIANQRVH